MGILSQDHYWSQRNKKTGRQLNSNSPLLHEDLDLDRILQLVDIIKRYELLVEYLLAVSDPIILDEEFDYFKAMNSYRQRIVDKALAETGGNRSSAARLMKTTMRIFYHKYTSKRNSGLKKDKAINDRSHQKC